MPGEEGDWEAALGVYLLYSGPFTHRLSGEHSICSLEETIGPSLVDEKNMAKDIHTIRLNSQANKERTWK